MQATSGIKFENVGRRFRLANFLGPKAPSTVSGRLQNWLDADGSVAGFDGKPAILASGLRDCGLWWMVDDRVVNDSQGPLKFIRKNDGPQRGVGHFRLEWDSALHSQVGETICGNGESFPCPAVGYIRHAGTRFAPDAGLPVTARADIAGLVGGYRWYLRFNNRKAPKRMTISQVEVDPATPMLLSLAYPKGTSFTITANAAYCSPGDPNYSCSSVFRPVSSVTAVRKSAGNTYHVSSDGVLTIRIVQTAQTFVGRPDWFLPSWDSPDRGGPGTFALNRFERKGIRLPVSAYGPTLVVEANCPATGAYCSGVLQSTVTRTVDNVCPRGFTQRSYDRCCSTANSTCVYANGAVALENGSVA
jgi:hypothetical protein